MSHFSSRVRKDKNGVGMSSFTMTTSIPCEANVSAAVRADCIVSCAADLYNSRDARLGVMDVGDGSLEPYRVSSDPLRSVWPKLNAAGVPTGGLVIA